MASESIVLKSVANQPQPARVTYVLDTSVLLADPIALSRFAEHEVIIPITVISELESKRDHPDKLLIKGWVRNKILSWHINKPKQK